ncbi:MAG: hypothetical protein ABEK00_03715 [Candidatus Nanohaloarchaea archaeon]
MVTAEQFDGQDSFACDICGFHYEEPEEAEACEEYCETHEGCSSELAKKALETGGDAA